MLYLSIMEIREIIKELERKKIKRHSLSLNETAVILGSNPNTVKEWINDKIILGINHYDPYRKKIRYVVPVWFLKNLLEEEDYQIYLEELKKIFDKKSENKTLFLNATEVARFLSLSPQTIIRWINEGSLKALKIYNPRTKRCRYLIPFWRIKKLFSEQKYEEFLSLLQEGLKETLSESENL